MKRREFITLLGGAAAAWPLAARAQQGERVRRVGVLSNFAESDLEAQSMVEALHQTLQELGWVEGRNLRFDHRWAAGNSTRIQAFAKALVALQPDVIVGHVTPAVTALRKETSTIPIVFIQVSDPIGAGFIANLAHPGGNITGFTTYEPSMVGKWVEMLKEMAPRVSRLALRAGCRPHRNARQLQHRSSRANHRAGRPKQITGNFSIPVHGRRRRPNVVRD